jgi:hypothetical protein
MKSQPASIVFRHNTVFSALSFNSLVLLLVFLDVVIDNQRSCGDL